MAACSPDRPDAEPIPLDLVGGDAISLSQDSVCAIDAYGALACPPCVFERVELTAELQTACAPDSVSWLWSGVMTPTDLVVQDATLPVAWFSWVLAPLGPGLVEETYDFRADVVDCSGNEIAAGVQVTLICDAAE